MNATKMFLAAGTWLALAGAALADATTESVQRSLKEQGFYYGEITGTKDADTTAAIRRYQIRNGLKITGELNPETMKSLGLRGGVSSTSRATPAPTVIPRRQPIPETSDLRDDSPLEQRYDSPRRNQYPEEVDEESAAPFERNSYGGVFSGTPFATAPPEVQERVIAAAQSILAQRGYYRSVIDGIFGPGTEFALRAFQARVGLAQTGRLDTETLAVFGLLPGQRASGFTVPTRRRVIRRPPPVMMTPDGEPVYIPR